MSRVCEVDGCEREHVARGYCRAHYKRLLRTGDPLQPSRFATEDEKQAYIAADIDARRERRAANREQREQERHLEAVQRRVLSDFAPIRPDARALVEVLDSLPPDDRAAIASALTAVLFGRPIDATAPTASTTASSNDHADPTYQGARP